jgi:lipopolysaccharide export system protein LptA
LLLLALGVARTLASPVDGRAQQACDFSGTGEAGVVGGAYYLKVARMTCSDMRIRADSATVFQESSTYRLFGNVFIDNADITLRARNAQYYPDNGLINAQGSVVVERKADGTRITGAENLVFNRAGSSGRTEDVLTVSGGRPKAVLPPRPREDAPPDSLPYEITANRIVVRGEERLEASGNVEILRGDLDARANDVLYLGDTGQLRLTGSASLDVETYMLTGGLILVTMVDDEIQEVVARQNAQLTGDFTLDGGMIEIQMRDGVLDRVTAGPDGQAGARQRPQAAQPDSAAAAPRQASAIADEYTITGERVIIEVDGDRLESLDARGAARVVSTAADSINAADTPEIARRDWIEGETILATFTIPDTLAADSSGAAMPDSAAAGKPRLEMLFARVNARALVRMPAADTTNASDPACDVPGRFAVHYVIGDSITIRLAEGTVEDMEVIGQVEGHHWEPPACASAPAPDTLPPPSTPPAAGRARPNSGAPPPPLPSDAGSAASSRPWRSGAARLGKRNRR